jgi:histone H1/5
MASGNVARVHLIIAKYSPVHSRTSEMVARAISCLKERGGCSLPAIKKHIKANYKVDSEKLSLAIKMYLKTAVASGKLVQTKGKRSLVVLQISSCKRLENYSVCCRSSRPERCVEGPKRKEASCSYS